MNSGLYICPGAPATCSAAVRAIWLARPGTSVSKVSALFSLWREADGGGTAAARSRKVIGCAPAVDAGLWQVERGHSMGGAVADAPLAVPPPALRGAGSRAARLSSSRTGSVASSLSTDSISPAYCARIQSSLKRLGTRTLTTAGSPAACCSTAGGSGRIQVLNWCSGSCSASRSQARCHRSGVIVENLSLQAADCRCCRRCGGVVIHSFMPGVNGPATACRRGASV